MTNQELENRKYPIGKFHCPKEITEEHISQWISILEALPTRLETLVKNLNNQQLDTAYRPKGCTIRQVVHHISEIATTTVIHVLNGQLQKIIQ
ncbi:hypothetical protein [Lacinutrix sp.]|uniref:hypothetical protein n=1 Tax=Lacinutrix sp. TaxID=1937692 RepID=UPI0034541C2B